MPDWHIYMVRTETGALYTGISNDVEKRIEAHRLGRGSKFLRAQGALVLVYQCALGDRSIASKAEYRLKQISKAEKELLVQEKPDRIRLLEKLEIECP
jgi:putative endonuclease